jgi:hypothetical protein
MDENQSLELLNYVSDFYLGEDSCCDPACDSFQCGRWLPTFRGNIMLHLQANGGRTFLENVDNRLPVYNAL